MNAPAAEQITLPPELRARAAADPYFRLQLDAAIHKLAGGPMPTLAQIGTEPTKH